MNGPDERSGGHTGTFTQFRRGLGVVSEGAERLWLDLPIVKQVTEAGGEGAGLAGSGGGDDPGRA